jgi:hypothetical protein
MWFSRRNFLIISAMAALPTGCNRHEAMVNNSAAMPVAVSSIAALTCHPKSGFSAGIGKEFERDKAGEKMDLTFTGFDWVAQKAQVIGNNGVASVTARLEQFGDTVQMILLERTPMGNVTLTSVFFSPARTASDDGVPGPHVLNKEASAVHSRHILIGGPGEASASVSQWTGVCEIKS